MKKKFDCWSCKYRDKVVGSCHICCNHPSVNEQKEDKLMTQLASVGRVESETRNSKELNIKANQYGIKSGWFNFPFDFDPVWLQNCDGYVKCVEVEDNN